MDKTYIKEKVKSINNTVQKYLWMDFRVQEYTNNELVVIGRIDDLGKSNLEIRFKDIFFVSLPFEWKTDTKENVLKLLDGDQAKAINLYFKVEQGYYLFRFQSEYYSKDFGCLIGAKEIDFVETNINVIK